MADERRHTNAAPSSQPSTNSSLQVRCSSPSGSTPDAGTTQSLLASSPQRENHANPQPTEGDQRPQGRLPEGRPPSLSELQRCQLDHGRDTRGLHDSCSHGITPMARFESEQRGDAPWNIVAMQHRQPGTSSRQEHPALPGFRTDNADRQNATNAPQDGEKTEELRRQEEDIAFAGDMFDSEH